MSQLKLRKDIVFQNAPQPYASLWNNVSVLENQLAEKLLARPAALEGFVLVDRDAWLLVEAGDHLQLCHANLVGGELVDETSRFDVDLGWVDIEEDALQSYLDVLQTAVEEFDERFLDRDALAAPRRGESA